MGRKDITTKEFMADSRIFADAFNFLIHGGEQVIDPGSLRPLDTAATGVLFGTDGTEAPVQKYRDELKYLISMEDDSAVYLLLGIENQSSVNYAMPVKNMVYDALQYAAQVEKTAKVHRTERTLRKTAGQMSGEHPAPHRPNAGEYLSGFYKGDRLIPVITLVVFFSAGKWDGPRSIHEMFAVTDPGILSFVSDYRINLIAPEEMGREDFDRFATNLREVLLFIRYSEDKQKLRALVAEDERFRSVERDAVRVIETVTGSGLIINEKDEVVDVCRAIEEIKEEGRVEGRTEGRTAGKAEAILILLSDLRGQVSQKLRSAILNEKDTDALTRYLRLAASVNSVDEFVSRLSRS